ncbi:NAD(P)H-dependent oxidoreductase [Spirillospora sp. NPDC048911]|uniref:NAD(P)H-dependent oxidoreductase n=1 Tax=Spirillospora sp. NPDC048911 TaxID=3364527 RepID=UPI00371EC4D9
MGTVSFVVIIGNPRSGSRTATAAIAAARAVAAAAGIAADPEIIDLSALGPRLLRAEPSAAVEDALAQVLSADVILVASPTYKGTYTGLLKVFLDRVPGGALAGKAALPLLLLGAPRHALAVEVHLRPLLVELGASVPTPGLALLETQLDRLDSLVAEWAAQISPAVRGALTAGAAR